MTKILVISDYENHQYFKCNSEQLEDIDFIISCGDLSLGYLNDVQKMLKKPLYFLYGNHIGKSLVYRNIKYIGNKTVDVCGLKITGIDGIEANDSERIRKRTEKLLRQVKTIDILVTHCPTKGFGDGEGYHVGSECFKELYDKANVKLHFYGHYHLNYGGTRELDYNGIRLINAYDHYIVNI